MDSADCIHDGFVIPVKLRPVDGHFPVGPEFHDQQPSRIGQLRPTAGSVHDVPGFPGIQQPIAIFHELESIGPDSAQATRYGNILPGGLCQHAPSPGQPMLSFNQMMLRCSEMMELLVQQQHQLQQALSTMAAAPSFMVSTVHEVPLQNHGEVMLAAQCSPALCYPAQATTPHSSINVCHGSSTSTENDRSHPRAHTNTIIDTPTPLEIANPARRTMYERVARSAFCLRTPRSPVVGSYRNSAASGSGEVLSDGGFSDAHRNSRNRDGAEGFAEQKVCATALRDDEFSIPVYLPNQTLT